MFTKCISHTNFNVAVSNEFHLIIILMKKVVKKSKILKFIESSLNVRDKSSGRIILLNRQKGLKLKSELAWIRACYLINNVLDNFVFPRETRNSLEQSNPN